MSIVFSKSGTAIGHPLPDRAYWAVKRKDGTFVCELDEVSNFQHGRHPLDWTLDIISTGDWRNITELWLICPPTPTSPGGNTARLPIQQPGTAFQLKVGHLNSTLAAGNRTLGAQLIGRVTDWESGACECFIFDYEWQALSQPWPSNIYRFGTWRSGIAPIGTLALDVLGLRPPTSTTTDGCGGCDQEIYMRDSWQG